MLRKTNIYTATNNINNPVIEQEIEFDYTNGTFKTTKMNNALKLQEEVIKNGYDKSKLLEISTISNIEFGKRLSALNLVLRTKNKAQTVEQIYQLSKMPNKGNIEYFQYGHTIFPSEPKTMYYDYIYMLALYQHPNYWEDLEEFTYFTDVFFNKEKQINTQARAAAIFKTLLGNNDMLDIFASPEYFKDYYENIKILHK